MRYTVKEDITAKYVEADQRSDYNYYRQFSLENEEGRKRGIEVLISQSRYADESLEAIQGKRAVAEMLKAVNHPSAHESIDLWLGAAEEEASDTKWSITEKIEGGGRSARVKTSIYLAGALQRSYTPYLQEGDTKRDISNNIREYLAVRGLASSHIEYLINRYKREYPYDTFEVVFDSYDGGIVNNITHIMTLTAPGMHTPLKVKVVKNSGDAHKTPKNRLIGMMRDQLEALNLPVEVLDLALKRHQADVTAKITISRSISKPEPTLTLTVAHGGQGVRFDCNSPLNTFTDLGTAIHALMDRAAEWAQDKDMSAAALSEALAQALGSAGAVKVDKYNQFYTQTENKVVFLRLTATEGHYSGRASTADQGTSFQELSTSAAWVVLNDIKDNDLIPAIREIINLGIKIS